MYSLEYNLPLEVLKNPDFLKNQLQNAFKKFNEETGKDPAFYFYTFRHDDYEKKRFILTLLSQVRLRFWASVPARELEPAIKLLVQLNSHLKIEITTSGHNADDFVYDRLTLIIKIIMETNTLRFDIWGADQAGEQRHPKQILKELGVQILKYEGVPMADCFFFEVDRLPDPIPPHFEVVDYKIEESTTGI